jgi:hypothetical protein
VTRNELAKVVDAARCRVIGADDAGNAGHRLTLAALIRAFDRTESALLCEPSLARKTTRPPDVVLIDPEVGVHVIEVKGVALDQVEGLEAGGQIGIRYAARVRVGNPLTQARNAMFDIKDATARAFDGDVRLPFKYWAAFPLIRRADWVARFGADAFCPAEFLFADDLKSAAQLARRLGSSSRSADHGRPVDLCPLDQLQAVWRAFGDTSVLYATPEERPQRSTDEGTLGEQFDEAAEAYKVLSDEQQRLSIMNWENGPRLIRGVAGSGKTVVLANNLARRLERMLVANQEGLFGSQPSRPRLLAVCFNRTLAPFIEKKIVAAFLQRTGRPLPEGMVEVCSFNTLMYRLMTAGLWRYQSVTNANEIVRAMQYLGDLDHFRLRDPTRLAELAYDAIYVDEGQDFVEEEFRLLKELCRARAAAEPNLYVFYDDAQNLYGRTRPNWQSLGLNVRGGRSYVMTQCFRNTRPVMEATLNVLYGSCAPRPHAQVPTREFGDLAGLEQRGLIADDGGFWRVRYASRDGVKPILSLAANPHQETQQLVARLRWLIEEQEVRPEDILLLAFSRQRVAQLADAAAAACIKGVDGIHAPLNEKEKDRRLGERGRLTVSTVASAKGYDAYCVLLASANEFSTDVMGRANFYVGCTRAIEYLEVFAYEHKGLAAEMAAVLERMG